MVVAPRRGHISASTGLPVTSSAVRTTSATEHGIRAKRSKSGAVSFEVVDLEAENAPVE
jgi:hypothetical protein